jgi:hypothetical protein
MLGCRVVRFTYRQIARDPTVVVCTLITLLAGLGTAGPNPGA